MQRLQRARADGHAFRACSCVPNQRELRLNTQAEVQRILDEVLSLRGRAMSFTADTPLLGAIPELDSMAVVTLITTVEERFGIAVDDDDISGDAFATLGSLTAFVAERL
jgi:acyl carrier protein